MKVSGMCYMIETGIDSFSAYYPLTWEQKNKMIEELKARTGFRTLKEDYFQGTYIYASNCFVHQGIKITISSVNQSVWGLYIIVHPTLVLGNENRSALYGPAKPSYKKMLKIIDKFLNQVCAPCSLENMKLSRVDVTMNLIFDDSDMVNQYLRIIKKGLILPHYQLDWFRKNQHKAKDPSAANRHSYTQRCKSASFFAYDKTAQLEMIDCFPDALIDKHILRLEAQLKPKALKKWLSNAHVKTFYKTLKELSDQASKIMRWYLKRMRLLDCQHTGYEEAAEIISNLKNKKTRERMLYLLRKTSDKRDLSAALVKLKEHYGLKTNQVNHILRKFHKLGISPITIPNAEDKALPSLAALFYQ